MTPTASPCPRCGTAASGNYCATCGAPLSAAACVGCGTALAAGGKFCHRCGTAAQGDGVVVSAPPRPGRSPTPWIVAGLLTVLAISSVVYAASKRNAAQPPSMANAGNAAAGTSDASGIGPAPDISNMTPREQFDRLHDRVVGAAERNDTATVIRFWPMASGAYDRLPTGDRDADARYHMAALHLLVGQFPAALALADTILAMSPNNLTGYYIRGLAAEFQADSAPARAAKAAFRAHFDAEITKPQPEYTHHRPLLDQYLRSIGTN